MNHSPDPQLCTMSDAEEGFRNTLREVFGSVEWIVTEVRSKPGSRNLFAILSNDHGVTVDFAEGTSRDHYTVTLGAVRESASTLRHAADNARAEVSTAVRALESVGMEVES